jgi:hypothetical protein
MLSTEKTTPIETFEEVQLDFDAYLGRRLGIDRAAAKTVLGRWLESYEPAESHPGLAASRRQRSGIFPSPMAPETQATAKTDAA